MKQRQSMRRRKKIQKGKDNQRLDKKRERGGAGRRRGPQERPRVFARPCPLIPGTSERHWRSVGSFAAEGFVTSDRPGTIRTVCWMVGSGNALVQANNSVATKVVRRRVG